MGRYSLIQSKNETDLILKIHLLIAGVLLSAAVATTAVAQTPVSENQSVAAAEVSPAATEPTAASQPDETLPLLPSLAAQQSQVAALEQRVAELTEEQSRQAQRAERWEKLQKHLKISGLLQLGYEWNDWGESTFYLLRARVTLGGEIAKGLDYRLQLEFASPKIIDAYFQYRPWKQLGIKVGQYKLPFTLDNTHYGPLQAEMIEIPLAVQHAIGSAGMGGLKFDDRDLGATLSGSFLQREGYSILSYDLGVFNGEGKNKRDANRSKDVVGRLIVSPVRGLLLSGSVYWGEIGADYTERLHYAAGAAYDCNNILFRAEYIGGQAGEFRSQGLYASAGWWVHPKWMPALRYDYYNEELAGVGQLNQQNYTVGVLWQPVKWLRCQFNYIYEQYNASELADRNVVMLQFTGSF